MPNGRNGRNGKRNGHNHPTDNPIDRADMIYDTDFHDGSMLIDDEGSLGIWNALGTIGVDTRTIKTQAKTNCRVCHGQMDKASGVSDLCNNCYYLGIIGLGTREVTDDERDDSEGEDEASFWDGRKSIWD
jgi:hypothetical protein